jgi:hypothetical protein
MIIDIVHGYQPFTKDLVRPWVYDNMDDVYVPTSNAMKEGVIKRNVQVQGWTIDEWKRVRGSSRVIRNLKQAYIKGNIALGCSTYSHVLMPLLSYELNYALLYLDLEVIDSIGRPVFFFPPELAIDGDVLRMVFDNFPELIPVLPCTCLNKMDSEVVDILHKKNKFQCLLANIFLKDTLMNGTVYQNISYLPEGLSLVDAQLAMRAPVSFKRTIEALDKSDLKIIPRDWENAESRDALYGIDEGLKDIKAYLSFKDEFVLINDQVSTSKHRLSDIIPSSWEPAATGSNPYPYWTPKKNLDLRKKTVISNWLGLIAIYEQAFMRLIEGDIGNVKMHKKLIRFTSPSLISCVPWHYLSRPEWENDTGFAAEMIRKIVNPRLKYLVSRAYPGDSEFEGKIDSYCNKIIG